MFFRHWQSLPHWLRGGILATAILTLSSWFLQMNAGGLQEPVYSVPNFSLEERLATSAVNVAPNIFYHFFNIFRWIPWNGTLQLIIAAMCNFIFGAACGLLYGLRSNIPYIARGTIVSGIIGFALLSDQFSTSFLSVYKIWIGVVIAGTLIGLMFHLFSREKIFIGLAFMFIPLLATIIDLHMQYEGAVMKIAALPAVYGVLIAMYNSGSWLASLYLGMGILRTIILWIAIGETAYWICTSIFPAKRYQCLCALYLLMVAVSVLYPTYLAESHRRRMSAIGYTIEQCEKIDPTSRAGTDRYACISSATIRRVQDGDVDPLFCESAYVTREHENSTCWGRLAVKTMNEKLCEKVRMDYGERDRCIADVAMKKQDAHVCESIGMTSDVRSQCFADMAKQKQDVRLCSTVSADKLIACKLDALRNNPKALLEVCNTPNLSPDDLSLCKHQQNISLVASTDTCTGITNELLRAKCWGNFGSNHGGEMGSKPTTEACKIATNLIDKGNCIEGVAEVWAYPSICDQIEDPAIKRTCNKRATIMSDYIRDFDAGKNMDQYAQYWDENGFKDSVR